MKQIEAVLTKAELQQLQEDLLVYVKNVGALPEETSEGMLIDFSKFRTQFNDGTGIIIKRKEDETFKLLVIQDEPDIKEAH